MKKVRVGIIGLGNCASGLIQGIEYYKQNPDRIAIGIMHEKIGNYDIRDIEIAAVFDVDKKKVGKKLHEAIYLKPNLVNWVKISKSDIVVREGPVLDGVGKYLEGIIEVEKGEKKSIDEWKDEIIKELKDSKVDVLVNYLPVGSQKATEFWAEVALESKTAFINGIPVFIASNPNWEKKFRERKIPIIGDDMKGLLGATIVHRILVKLINDRKAEISNTYQLNVGGNTDFLNMLERERLYSKKISKTESVQSQLDKPLSKENIHIGPSDYVSFLGNKKIAYIYIEGKMWADIPYRLELKLEVDDKANAAPIIADAVRIAKLAAEKEIGGALIGPCAYLMKHPPIEMSDEKAKEETEKLIEQLSNK